jgi:hypothetical protein
MTGKVMESSILECPYTPWETRTNALTRYVLKLVNTLLFISFKTVPYGTSSGSGILSSGILSSGILSSGSGYLGLFSIFKKTELGP